MAQNIKIQDLTGGWSTGEETTIAENQLSRAVNVSYDSQGILGVRKGVLNFGNAIAGESEITSIYFTTFNDGSRILLCAAGEDMYKYNEGTSDWDSIKSGFTSGQKFSFITYKNIIYWTNGVDNFMSYDGTTVNEHAAVPKGKYMVVQNDIIYMAGFSSVSDKGLLIYTPANPADVQTGLNPANYSDEYINQDEGDITGLSTLGPLVLVGKDKGVYTVNVFNSPVSIDPVDFDGDATSHRSFVNVENDTQFMSSDGIHSLAQRRGVTGAFRAFPLSRSIQKAMNQVKSKSSVAAYYYKPTNNVYWAANSGEGTINDTLFVYSVLVSNPSQFKYVFTKYENVNANDFTTYVDSDGENHLLVANATSGQVLEIETGHNDNGQPIHTKVCTKVFDFNSPEAWKTFPHVDVGGLISKNETVTFKLDVDGTESSKTFTGEGYAIGDTALDHALGEDPLGEEALGGGAVADDGIQYYPFLERRPYYASGQRIKVCLETRSISSGVKYTKLNIPVEVHDEHIFRTSSITT